MKKLRLTLGSINQLLSREQMKKVNGGYGEVVCIRDRSCSETSQDCGDGCECSFIDDPPGSPPHRGYYCS